MNREHLKVVGLQLRCAEPLRSSPFGFCGRPAEYFRPGAHLLPDAYVCAWHRASSDLPLPLEPLVRRVAIVAEIALAGVVLLPRPAQNEAVLRLQAAVDEIGGRLNVCSVTSVMARHSPPAPPGRATASGGA